MSRNDNPGFPAGPMTAEQCHERLQTEALPGSRLMTAQQYHDLLQEAALQAK
jgi:hypothetical protein